MGQLLDQQLSHTLPGVNLVWSPAAASNDSYNTNGLNQYTSVTGTALSYDGNGNLTSDLTGQSFTFDAENVLREVNGSGGARIASPTTLLRSESGAIWMLTVGTA